MPHQGRLYAGNCLWMETDSSIPKACQILVLDSPNGQWRVEHQFAVNSFRCSIVKEVTFSTDARGQKIAPVSLLLAAPDVRREAVKVFCRDDAAGDWSASVLGTVTKGATTRSLGLHRDKVTGIDRIFAGNRPLGVMSGVYDPAAPGRIRWDKSAEVEAPAGDARDGLLRLQWNSLLCNYAHIYRRHRRHGAGVERCLFLRERNSPARHSRPDGRAETRRKGRGALVRRLSEGPPVGSGRRFQGNHRTGPARVPDGKAGPSSGVRARRLQRVAPLRAARHGRNARLFGFACSYPAAVVNANPASRAALMKEGSQTAASGDGRYCIRHAKGANITYEVAEITDPRAPQLVATRTIVVSPFPEDHGKAFYFGGYDSGGVPSHNTAWIYRGELQRTAP